jgi:hypothetical protein
LLKASKTSVFFIDDNQVVRPGEIGSTAYIRAEAESSTMKSTNSNWKHNSAVPAPTLS